MIVSGEGLRLIQTLVSEGGHCSVHLLAPTRVRSSVSVEFCFSICCVSSSMCMWDTVWNKTHVNLLHICDWLVGHTSRIWFVVLRLAFHSLTTFLEQMWGPPFSYLGAQLNEWLAPEACHWPPCCTRVKNIWRFICIPTPYMTLWWCSA
jgi:hypothetical protein